MLEAPLLEAMVENEVIVAFSFLLLACKSLLSVTDFHMLLIMCVSQ